MGAAKRRLPPALAAKCWRPGQSGNPSGHSGEYGDAARAPSCARGRAKANGEAEFRQHRKEIEEVRRPTPRELDALEAFAKARLAAIEACEEGGADNDGAD